MTRRSAPHEARMVSFLGLHPIWNTSSVWPSNTCSRWLRLRQSCKATCGHREQAARETHFSQPHAAGVMPSTVL